MNYGMIRVAAASLKLKVANPSYNKEEIKNAIDRAVEEQVRVLVTPELSVTGATCGDLFYTKALQQASDAAVLDIAAYTKGKNIVVIIGAPVVAQGKLFDCAVVINNGKIFAAVPKYTVNRAEDGRWFDSGSGTLYSDSIDVEISTEIVIELGGGAVLGIELGKDLAAVEPPSNKLAVEGANIIVNLAAEPELASRAEKRRTLVASQSARCIAAYVYAGASVYESTTDMAFGGATIIAEYGKILAEGKRFQRESILTIADIDVEKMNSIRLKETDFGVETEYDIVSDLVIDNSENDLKYRSVDPMPFIPADEVKRRGRCEEIFAIQSSALARRLEHIGSRGCVIGISGGLDSTLSLLVSVEAMKLLGKPMSDIIGITMPGFGTTDRTYNNALDLMKSLGVTVREISIKDACLRHFKDIGHNPEIKDVTYENTQARERTQILFDIANQQNCLLVGTGDLSEEAMGWCTFNGDQMSMYNPNGSVPKTLVRHLVRYVAETVGGKTGEILLDILDTPVSPELLPPDESGKIAQKTEDNIGPYELHDFFIYNFVRYGFEKEKLAALALKAFDDKYDRQTVEKWLAVFFRRFFISQFKRSCSPDGPKVGSVSLSPRGDWNMPSDASFDDFI